jgi:aspartate racemase
MNPRHVSTTTTRLYGDTARNRGCRLDARRPIDFISSRYGEGWMPQNRAMVATIGLVGGIAPESTIDYYRKLVAAHQARTADGSYPPIVINSIDLKRMLELVAAEPRQELVRFLGDAVRTLIGAGCSVAALASNTPHVVFEELQAASNVPMVSIVEAAAATATRKHLRRLALLGTRFTMAGTFYPAVFSGAGIDLVTPDDHEQDLVHGLYMNELVKGTFRRETKEAILGVIARLRSDERIDGVLLAGTELPLLLRGADAGVELLDTTEIHVATIADAAWS